MKHERNTDSTFDDRLDREIEDALAVDPSPDFLARVRTRIAEEPRIGTPLIAWRLAGAVVCAAIVVMAIAVTWPREKPAASVTTRRVDAPPRVREEPPAITNDAAAIAAAPPRATAPRWKPLAPPLEHAVVISSNEAAALKSLFDDISAGRIQTASLPPDRLLGPLGPIDEIRIDPIVVDELTPIR